MTTGRRDFLKLATTGAVAAGVLGAATARASTPAPAIAASRLPDGGTPGSVDPEERRRLIAKAVFGPKDRAEGDGGMVFLVHAAGATSAREAETGT